MSYTKRLATQIMLDFSDSDCRLVELFEDTESAFGATEKTAAVNAAEIAADHIRRIARAIAEAAGRDEPNATDEQDAIDLAEHGYSIDNLPAAFWNGSRQRLVWLD